MFCRVTTSYLNSQAEVITQKSTCILLTFWKEVLMTQRWRHNHMTPIHNRTTTQTSQETTSPGTCLKLPRETSVRTQTPKHTFTLFSYFDDLNASQKINWGDFKREDVASAVVQFMCDRAASFAFHAAVQWKVKHVIACGSFFNHPSVWPRVASSYLQHVLPFPLQVI